MGSRTNTQYGEKMCKTFTKKLVEYEVTIISGLAIGIDAIAHKICIKYFGKTIAVLPCGFDNIYPKQNKELIDEILEKNGLIITEYEKEHFHIDRTFHRSCGHRNSDGYVPAGSE